MLKNKHYKYGLLVITALMAVMVSFGGKVGAQAGQPPLPTNVSCGSSDQQPYTAMYQATPDVYDVYVRLGTQGQTAPTTLYYQAFSASACQKIGSAQATGDAWIKLGQWASTKGADAGTFSLTSSAINSLPNANRPTIMLVSKTHPACIPAAECTVSVGGSQGVVRAAGTLLNEDNLHVVTAIPPASDTIKRVDYYVDNRPVYSKSSLSPFDLRYVSAGSHTLTTEITYASKQRVILASSIDRGFSDELNYLFFSFLYGQRTLLQIIAMVALIALLWIAGLSTVRYFYKRHLWKVTHFVQTNSNPRKQAEIAAKARQPHIIKPPSLMRQIVNWVIPVIVLSAVSICLVAVLVTFVVQPYQVDGPSMQSTLYTGDYLAVNRLPQTWAHITGKKYIPPRGAVVVAKKEKNPLIDIGGGGGEYIVKRVIGLPGERVVLINGTITIYNAARPAGFNPDTNVAWATTYHRATADNIDITLGPDELFVVGDNRPDSVDSRSYGAIKSENVVGRVVFRALPITHLRRL